MFKEEPNFSPELGQLILSNGSFFSEEAYWACEGLIVLRAILQESKILEWNDWYDYEGKVFAYRQYCWCDGDNPGHEEGCPSNFVHYPSGLEISWYKHEGRGITSNRNEMKAIDWWNILADCVNEIKEYEFK
jgi:hypothetical protein